MQRIAKRSPICVFIALVGILPVRAEESRVLPTEPCGDYYMVRMAVNDDPDRILFMLLDTGANRSIIDPDALERIGGKRLRPGGRARFSLLTAGEVRFKKLRATALELDHLQRVLGKPMDGILGFPAFRGLLLTFDYPGSEVRVRFGELPKADGRHVLELVKERDRPWIDIDFGTTTRAILIDTGSSSGLSIRSSSGLAWRHEPLAFRGALRIDSLEIREAGRLDEDVLIGAHRLVSPTVELTKGTELVGTRILREFVVTFDQKRRRVHLEPRGEGPIEFPAVRDVGLALMPRPEGFVVVRAFEGLAAVGAGMREDDVIVAIDGTPVYEQDLCDRDDPTEPSVAMTIRRNDETLEIEVPVEVIVP